MADLAARGRIRRGGRGRRIIIINLRRDKCKLVGNILLYRLSY